MRNIQMILLMAGVALMAACQGPQEAAPPAGPFAGSAEPGLIPELFAPGFITTGLYERDIAITADGKEIYFSVFLGDWVTIMYTRDTGQGWTEPEAAPFARDTAVNYCEPAFSPDGSQLLFLCTRPTDGSDPKTGWQDQNIWMVTRGEDGHWSEPSPLPPSVNAGDQFFPSFSRNGELFFCRTDSTGASAVFTVSWPLAEGAEAEMLPTPVNGTGSIYNACISPDGSCLVGCVTGRDGETNPRKAAYYAFFREANGWSEGVRLDSVLQIAGGNAISPAFSPDGRYFFFATNKTRSDIAFSRGTMNMTFFQERRAMPGNGNSDIYWIAAEAVHGAKKQ